MRPGFAGSGGLVQASKAAMNETRHPSAVVFGAGSVGRGFLGQLLSESGYEVVFVDVDEVLVRALAARGAYTLRLAGVVRVEELVVGPVRAVGGRDAAGVARELAQARLVATAVGARALSAIGTSIAAGLDQRWKLDERDALNIIICENLPDAPERLGAHIRAALSEEFRSHLSSRLGLVPAVIARMSPVPTAAQRAGDPTLVVAEPYKVLPVDRDGFVGAIPEIVGLRAVAPFGAYTARKLYIHNAAHAVLGYLGYRRGHIYGYEALDDPWIRARLDEGLEAVSRSLTAAYDFEPVGLLEHIDYLLIRLANRALADPCTRLARDPLRKLAPDDRLVGAARLVEAHGISPRGLAWGIAAALTYDHPDDGHAVALQKQIRKAGVVRVLNDVCRIQGEEALGELVLASYAELKR